MPNAGEIILDVRAKHDLLQGDLNRAKGSIQSTAGALERGLNTSGMMNAISMLGGMMPGLGGQISMVAGNVGQLSGAFRGLTASLGTAGTAGLALAAALALVAGAYAGIAAATVPAAAAKEELMTIFEVLLKSKTAAEDLVGEMKALADRTPLETSDISKAGRTLLAMGFDIKEIIPMIETLGDAAVGAFGSAGAAEGMNRLARIMGQIKQKGRLQGDELLQLSEAGISPMKALSEATGKTSDQVRKMIEGGQIDANTAILAITAAIKSQFAGAMKAAADTWNGKLSTMKDAWTKLKEEIGKPIMIALKPKIDEMTKVLEGLSLMKKMFEGTYEDAVIEGRLKKSKERRAARDAVRDAPIKLAAENAEIAGKNKDALEKGELAGRLLGYKLDADMAKAKSDSEARLAEIKKQKMAALTSDIRKQAADQANAVVEGLQKQFNAHQEYLNRLKTVYDTYVGSTANARSRMNGITVDNVGKRQQPDWANMRNQMEQGLTGQAFQNYGITPEKQRSINFSGPGTDAVVQRLDRLINVISNRTIAGVAT